MPRGMPRGSFGLAEGPTFFTLTQGSMMTSFLLNRYRHSTNPYSALDRQRYRIVFDVPVFPLYLGYLRPSHLRPETRLED